MSCKYKRSAGPPRRHQVNQCSVSTPSDHIVCVNRVDLVFFCWSDFRSTCYHRRPRRRIPFHNCPISGNDEILDPKRCVWCYILACAELLKCHVTCPNADRWDWGRPWIKDKSWLDLWETANQAHDGEHAHHWLLEAKHSVHGLWAQLEREVPEGAVRYHYWVLRQVSSSVFGSLSTDPYSLN